MKVLISAIACNPVHGSEATHGWMACCSLSKLADLWLIVSGESKAAVEEARAAGQVPANMHFTFIGGNRPYHENRLLARFQSWSRYIEFNRDILPVAKEMHGRIGFDIAHHVTLSTWRVGCPLWQLGIPMIWGPISGTEVFPLRKLGKILSLKSWAFEIIRKGGSVMSYLSPSVRKSARNAFHIFAAHREATSHLGKLRGTQDGMSVLSYYSFSPDRITAMSRPNFSVRTGRPLKIFGAGNLEGRKGVAIALHALSLVKKQGVKFAYRITSRGPEFEHLQALAHQLGLENEVDLGRQLPRGEYFPELWDSDLYLLPSLREGGGLTMMEAMLGGCVPIVADCGGPGTAVTDECGVRIPVNSLEKMAADIAAAVIRFDGNRELITQMGQAANRRIAEQYKEQSFLSAIQAVYQDAVASRSSK